MDRHAGVLTLHPVEEAAEQPWSVPGGRETTEPAFASGFLTVQAVLPRTYGFGRWGRSASNATATSCV
jgi:hypothetical protein